MRTYKIAVFVSGSGTNFQSILDAMDAGAFGSKVVLCHSNKKDAYGLTRAKNHGIPTLVSKDDDEILQALEDYDIDMVVLAGYLRILSDKFFFFFKGFILNIHPSLLPKYGGMGMFGIHVHEAVFAHGDKRSGATVHLVTSVVDGGKILLQEDTSIEDCKSPEEIQARVLEIEHRILPRAIGQLEEV